MTTIENVEKPNADSWTIQKILQWTTQHFSTKGISSSRLDSDLLLSSVLKCKRLDLYLKFDQPLRPHELKTYKELVVRRSKREPIAYILNNQEFYGRIFEVQTGVLIPRPETEHLVDEALRFLKERTLSGSEIKVLDIGCGSGVIGLTLAAENPKVALTALDISPIAISLTETNAKKFGLSAINVIHKSFPDFSENSDYQFEMIVTNPPYISAKIKESLSPDVANFEPAEALFGGAEGHEILEDWLPRCGKLLTPGGILLSEIGYDQGEVVKKIMAELSDFKIVEVIRDYSGHQRILKAMKSE